MNTIVSSLHGVHRFRLSLTLGRNDEVPPYAASTRPASQPSMARLRVSPQW